MIKKIIIAVCICIISAKTVCAEPTVEYGYEKSLVVTDNNELFISGSYGNKQYIYFTKIADNVISAIEDTVSRESYVYILKKDFALYLLEPNGETKIAEQVDKVVDGDGNVFFIKKDKSLWGFGRNQYGILGDGMGIERTDPIKIMDNVRCVYGFENKAFAITYDNELYAWGDNTNSNITSHNYNKLSKPVKIMDDVVDIKGGTVDLDREFYLVLNSAGELYLWGVSKANRLGEHMDSIMFEEPPLMITDNVKAFDACSSIGLILKNDDSLWAIAEKETEYTQTAHMINGSLEPVQIESDVKEMFISMDGFSLILKNDGELIRYYTFTDDDRNHEYYLKDSPIHNNVTDIFNDDTPPNQGYAYVLCDDNSVWAMGGYASELGIGISGFDCIYAPVRSKFLSELYGYDETAESTEYEHAETNNNLIFINLSVLIFFGVIYTMMLAKNH